MTLGILLIVVGVKTAVNDISIVHQIKVIMFSVKESWVLIKIGCAMDYYLLYTRIPTILAQLKLFSRPMDLKCL